MPVLPSRLTLPVAALAGALAMTACAGRGADTAVEPAAASTSAEFPRTVEHAMGSTTIPEEPEHVVVLDTGELDSALSLGITPVGAVTTDVSDEFLSYLAADAAGIETVGTIAEPNLEEIAALRPDLILSNAVRHTELYDELTQIAPTVFAEDVGAAWKENFELAAEALGREEEAAEAMAAYEDEAAELGERIGDPAGVVVSPVRFVGGTIRAYRPDSFIGTVLEDVGLSQPELPVGENDTFAEISPEQLPLVDADVILYSSYGGTDESGEESVVGGPLWPRLGAVESGRAYRVEDDVFYTGIGLRAAQGILDGLEENLAP